VSRDVDDPTFDDPSFDDPTFDDPAIDTLGHAMFWEHGFAELHVIGDPADELCEIG
jgi:hypothetical protein